MNITVITRLGNQEEYVSGQDTASKNEILDAISYEYANDDIERIEIKYDDIDAVTLDGGQTIEPGAIVSVSTLEELRTELGKFSG